ncbi:TPA: PEF-CTERM sorting domain-containing protein [Methanosarcinaceae archaeon]|nr:PEF-CTERM sorting domain-containing protein [Methanosarcinaceae archaeon]
MLKQSYLCPVQLIINEDTATVAVTISNGGVQESIPEFPTIAIPGIAILGLAFIFQRKED